VLLAVSRSAALSSADTSPPDGVADDVPAAGAPPPCLRHVDLQEGHLAEGDSLHVCVDLQEGHLPEGDALQACFRGGRVDLQEGHLSEGGALQACFHTRPVDLQEGHLPDGDALQACFRSRRADLQERTPTEESGPSSILANSHTRAPQMRSPMGNLPHELVAKIARFVITSSIRSAIAMKLCCKSWNKSFEISGPILVHTRNHPTCPAITLLKIPAHQGLQEPFRFEVVDCLCPPPQQNMCWGSSQGLLALKNVRNNKVCLHCFTCGYGRDLPDPPQEHTPKGIYLQGLSVFAVFTENGQLQVEPCDLELDRTLLYRLRLHVGSHAEGGLIDREIDGEDVELGLFLNWCWDLYPGTEGFVPMRSVNFMTGVTFAGATATNDLILDRIGRQQHQPFIVIRLAEQLHLDASMVTWMQNGQHIFLCGPSAYFLILTRSILNINEVGVRCFRIQHKGGRVNMVEVDSIGPYSVYLGANQPLVLNSMDGLLGRRQNTVYVEDSDGIVRTSRVLAIDIGTQEVWEIPFPDDMAVEPMDPPASWTAVFDDICHVGIVG